jgi:capsular polysaccharide transport system ATP-binding protein
MIRFENLSKSFWVRGQRKVIVDNLNLTLPTGRSLGLLGRNGAGKSTLMSIISGTLAPDSGRVVSDGSVSWPVGLRGAFHAELTGVQNVRYVARIYGVDSDELVEFVEDFAEIGPHFRMPMKSYSSGMRSRIIFGTAMGVRFDTYLVDEVTAVGDASFRRKSRAVFHDRMKRSSAVMVSHNMREMKQYCDSGVILEKGRMTYFDNIDEAIEQHEKNLGA